MIFLLPFLLIFASPSWSASSPDICDLLDLQNCSGVSKQGRRSSILSVPSPSTSSLLNPATVSFDRGVGLEAIHQSGNPVLFNIASGTGKVGAAFISTSMENTFFGNRVYELDDEYLRRRKNKKQYRTKKLSFAVAGKLYRKKNIALDAGLIFKRHSEIKRINPGAGLSGRVGFFTFGASVYQDDFHLDLVGHSNPSSGVPYEQLFGKTSYQERFLVTTYAVGAKIKNLSLDYGIINTKYKRDNESTTVQLISSSYIAGDFMFNLAIRNERSPAPKYVDGSLVYQDSKTDTFGGVQVSLGRYFILGINYNYFLLNEMSLMGTLFF